jgi:hypothetical protein
VLCESFFQSDIYIYFTQCVHGLIVCYVQQEETIRNVLCFVLVYPKPVFFSFDSSPLHFFHHVHIHTRRVCSVLACRMTRVQRACMSDDSCAACLHVGELVCSVLACRMTRVQRRTRETNPIVCRFTVWCQ